MNKSIRPKTLKILLIEDDDALRLVISTTLELGGHEVGQARDGLEGMKLLDRGRYDLVITDVVMPEMDGLEVLRDSWLHGFSGDIIAISGGGVLGIKDNLKVARYMGAAATLNKPFSTEELNAVIDRLAAKAPAPARPEITNAQ